MITPAKGDDEREQVDDGYCHVRQGVTVCTCASTGYGAGMENVRILLDFLGGASFDKGRADTGIPEIIIPVNPDRTIKDDIPVVMPDGTIHTWNAKCP